MKVTIYSVADCHYCKVLQYVLTEYNIPHEVINVLRLGEEGDGMSFSDYMKFAEDIPMIQRCTFPQVYIDDKHTGDMKTTLMYLQNENK